MANNGRYNGDEGFDHRFFSVVGKILIALGVLIFLLLFVIFCVTVYAICLKIRRSAGAHRRRREMIRSRRLEFVSEPGSVGIQSRPLQKSVIEGFPVFLYGSENREEGLECAVCLCEFEENEKGRTLPRCGHSFHVDCIDMWFRSHSTCPLCRTAAAAADPSPAVDCIVVIVAGETSGTSAEQVPSETVEKQ